MGRSPLLSHYTLLSLSVSCHLELILQGLLPWIGRLITWVSSFHVTVGKELYSREGCKDKQGSLGHFFTDQWHLVINIKKKKKEAGFRNRCKTLDGLLLKNWTYNFGSDSMLIRQFMKRQCFCSALLHVGVTSGGPIQSTPALHLFVPCKQHLKLSFLRTKAIQSPWQFWCLLSTLFHDHLGKGLPPHNCWATERPLGYILLWKHRKRYRGKADKCKLALKMQEAISVCKTLTVSSQHLQLNTWRAQRLF